jgi:hypothetical protein
MYLPRGGAPGGPECVREHKCIPRSRKDGMNVIYARLKPARKPVVAWAFYVDGGIYARGSRYAARSALQDYRTDGYKDVRGPVKVVIP